MSRATLALLVLASLLSAAPLVRCDRDGQLGVSQEVVSLPGFVEPHTPGSGQPEEMPPAPVIQTLLGSAVDLNRVSYLRTAFDVPGSPPPRVIMVLIPGFLGGATTFDPLARDLVRRFAGNLEVWAIDRRPNQLEDRLGAIHAAEGALEPGCQTSPPQPDCPIFEGAQFYFADEDRGTLGDFPGEDDLDLNLDGELDAQRPLVDSLGVSRLPALIEQDDARFMAYWGLDTYFRDWKLVVEEARAIVGDAGLVILGGHSQGTSWSSTFAAYDFDPDPAVTVAGYELIDGLVLLEGGGAGPGLAPEEQRDAESYFDRIEELATGVASAPEVSTDVFLSDFSAIPLQALATSGEVAAVAAFHQPDEPALIQRAPTFAGFPLTVLLGAASTNRAIAGFFLDDDYSPIEAFRASMGFSDDGPNQNFGPLPGLGVPTEVYVALTLPGGALRTWKEYDDPTLPSVTSTSPCDPIGAPVNPDGVGCAIVDNGPPSAPDEAARTNGLEREVTPLDNFLLTQFGKQNGFEWYFASGRPFLDFEYGRDSGTLVADYLANVDPNHEGPLVVTQNAAVDVPVIAIGGSNGLAPEAKDFDSYLGSIATPAADKEVHILGGYAHVDPLLAADNEAVPLIEDFVSRLLQRRLLDRF